MIYSTIQHVLPMFGFEGSYLDVEEIPSGHINNTYHLTYTDGDRLHHYTLQRINSYVFKDPMAVMRNIQMVTKHLRLSMERDGIDPHRRVLELIPTIEKQIMYRDNEGHYWRAYIFIENATAHDEVKVPAHFYEAGRGFGEFQKRLTDFPISRLSYTIPNFHNTPHRFDAFMESVANNRAGRAHSVQAEINFLRERRDMMGQIVQLIDSNELPLRVTHNDTKINNVMIDDNTGKAVCVIDLDTVMPGSSLYDFGDAIRFGASTAVEDEPDVSKISLDLEKFKLFTRGFVEETDGFLTKTELKLLPIGAEVLTCELVMRFLTDYLDGDLYFKVHSPEHNLIRTRAQMQLMIDMETKHDDMMAYVEGLIG
ncbi:aminoglycoside phosphotransferase family protein [Eubacteriales bacterium OttesenSCG-928-N13]|nr:aminoglycoside phosphotransferase family protein [Eubacteriales bacterium OttesenSCG-928-N13]